MIAVLGFDDRTDVDDGSAVRNRDRITGTFFAQQIKFAFFNAVDQKSGLK